jgi:hypothetical protein
MADTDAGAIALYFAHVVADKLRPLVPQGRCVLDFGDSRGRVALHLGAAGIKVVSPESGEGEGRERRYAGAYAEVCEWSLVRSRARTLAERLEEGAPVLVRLPRRAGQSAAEVVRDLGSGFFWQGPSALGLLVPGEEMSFWAGEHPHAFAALAALEGLVRTWPGFRQGGREALLLGVRR